MEESQNQSDAVMNFLRPIIDPSGKMTDEELSHVVRKAAHFCEFCLLAFEGAVLVFYIYGRFRVCGAVYVAAGTLLSADTDEYIQSFTGRGSQVSDVMLDFLGGLCGLAIGTCLSLIVCMIFKKRREKGNSTETVGK